MAISLFQGDNSGTNDQSTDDEGSAQVWQGPNSTQGDNMCFLLLANFWRQQGRGGKETVSQFQRPQLRPSAPLPLGCWRGTICGGRRRLLTLWQPRSRERERGWTPPSPFERMPFDQLSPTRLQQVPLPPHSASSWGLSLQHLSLWAFIQWERPHQSTVTTHVSMFSLTMVMAAAEGSPHCKMMLSLCDHQSSHKDAASACV